MFKAGKFNLDLGRRTRIMGIINATPDSFSGDGVYSNRTNLNVKQIIELAKEMGRDGADIIDIGGESTQPDSRPVSVREEMKRVIPLVRNIARNLKIPLSIDTYKSEVAKAALDNGASIVNDISGLRFDKRIAKLIAKFKAGVVIMHIRGKPRTMQKNIFYSSLIGEILSYLKDSINIALDAGVSPDSIAIDPGIGFGKDREHNLKILNNLSKFKILGFPILVGVSRKSFIGLTLKRKENERLMGTAGSVAISIINGANIVRVHDVKHISDVVKMADAIRLS